ncbi:hypothetical protein HK101_011323 [Irineochytrium annulatum]|nr:hypothetical protein HK101_011323 [Irineochytrium annulatum]
MTTPMVACLNDAWRDGRRRRSSAAAAAIATQPAFGTPGPGLPLDFTDADAHTLTSLVANILQLIQTHNDRLPPAALTRFHSKSPPGIGIHDYLARIVKYSRLEPVCLLILLIYVDRACERRKSFVITSLTIHRFIITALTLASKSQSDYFLSASASAKIGGISTEELNCLELELLFLLDWDLHVTAAKVQDYYSSLVRQRLLTRAGTVPEVGILDCKMAESEEGDDACDADGMSSDSDSDSDDSSSDESVDPVDVERLRRNSRFGEDQAEGFYYRERETLPAARPRIDSMPVSVNGVTTMTPSANMTIMAPAPTSWPKPARQTTDHQLPTPPFAKRRRSSVEHGQMMERQHQPLFVEAA